MQQTQATPGDLPTPLVTIRCITYNHEPYIRQCLEGFVMQKTTFPFEAVVHDDASTDGTAAIIREYAERYPDIIKPIYETENQYSKHDGSLRRIMDAHMRGKYIALCEGDDYWTDPLKLQKQVDFLEGHPEYGLVHGRAEVFDQGRKIFMNHRKGEFFSSVDDLLIANRVVTLTACYRRTLYLRYQIDILRKSDWKMGDYPLWLYLSFHAKVHFLPETVGVYRILEHSMSHGGNLQREVEFCLSACDISEYFAKKYGKLDVLKKIKRETLYSIMRLYISYNEDFKIYHYKKNLPYKDFSLKIWLMFFCSKISFLGMLLRRRWAKC